ncbi:MAG TPA: zinc ribbon domain-containing protein [Gaiellaceae bacterium]|nr:zinc ribbon domain-containing protein [Gaiellaceae bacterium]
MKCPACSATLPADARYCTACGRPVIDEAAPVSFSRVEPRWFGVAPPTLLLSVALGAVVVSVVVLAGGGLAFGLFLLGVGALLLALYVETARRRRNSLVARVSADVRDRAGSTWESLRARSVVAVESRRVHGELAAIRMQRRDALLALGEATHRSDGEAAAEAQKRLAELEERETALEAQLQAQVEEAGERIRKARLSVDRTVVAPPEE